MGWRQRLALPGFRFEDQRVGMTVDEPPWVALAAEEFGHAQVEGDDLSSATHVSCDALETSPVGPAVACHQEQDLQSTLAAALELN